MLWFNAVSLPLVFDTLVKKFARLCCAFALVPTSSPLFQAPCFTEAADWWLYFFFEPDRTVTNESGSRLYCMTRSLVLSVWRILWYVCAQQGRHCHALAGMPQAHRLVSQSHDNHPEARLHIVCVQCVLHEQLGYCWVEFHQVLARVTVHAPDLQQAGLSMIGIPLNLQCHLPKEISCNPACVVPVGHGSSIVQMAAVQVAHH